MAIIKVDFRQGSKTQGRDRTGTKEYLVGSDTNVVDSIDQILDASIDPSHAIPDYNAIWDGTDTGLLVTEKGAKPHDEDDGIQEGYWWIVEVSYEVPESVNEELDPRDRDWEWSKTSEKRELAIAASTFDTAGYIFPGSDAAHMVNLGENDAFTFTNGNPPDSGVARTVSRKRISLTKYVDDFSDLGATSWEDLDDYEDKINSDTITILDVEYEPREVLCDSVNYANVTENGFEVIRVTFVFVADKVFKHVFSFPSADFEQADANGKLTAIRDKEGNTVSTAQLLDDDGVVIPNPGFAPFIKTPFIVSGGAHVEKAFDPLTIPESIP